MNEVKEQDRQWKHEFELRIAAQEKLIEMSKRIEELESELLTLRRADAGNEEVEKQRQIIIDGLPYSDIQLAGLRISDIAITRGQQLRSSREEVERLKGCLKKSNDGFEECERKYYLELNKTEDLTAERDALQSQLAAMQGGSVEEVEALSGDFTVEECEDHTLIVWMNRNKKLAELARTAIQQRDEVVGLLKWLDEFYTFREVKSEVAEYASSSDYGEDQLKARRILQIVSANESGEVGE